MSKDEMMELFKSAPMGSRHERMLRAAWKIAHLTQITEGGAYRMLLLALIDAEKTDKAVNDRTCSVALDDTQRRRLAERLNAKS